MENIKEKLLELLIISFKTKHILFFKTYKKALGL